MTIEELTTLADVMRGEKVTPEALARKVLQQHADLQARREKEKHAPKSKTRRNLLAKIDRLENTLDAKQKALDFAVRRNEVLRKQITGGAS